MRLVFDRAAQKAAINTIRELIDAGLAGNDCYQHEIFVVDAPQVQRDLADVALDILGAPQYRQGAFRSERHVLQAQLPHWVRVELDLDKPGAPEIVVPLCSRAVEMYERERETSLQMAANVNRACDAVFGPAPTPIAPPLAVPQLRLIGSSDR